MLELKDKHCGETCYIIGKGNSIKKLSNDTIGEGFIIALNQAIQVVEEVCYSNETYSMQKDGASPNIRDHCPCVEGEITECPHDMVTPIYSTLLLHEHESKFCLPNYEKKIIFDAEQLNLYMFTPSVVCAIELAKYMGAVSLKMIGFDSYTDDDNTNIIGKVDETYPTQRLAIDKALENIEYQFIRL